MTLLDLNIWPNDYYLVSLMQCVTHAYLPTKFAEKNCSKLQATEHIMKWLKFDLFVLLWHHILTHSLSGRRGGLTHTYLPTKLGKFSIKIATCREGTRIVLRPSQNRLRCKQGMNPKYPPSVDIIQFQWIQLRYSYIFENKQLTCNSVLYFNLSE